MLELEIEIDGDGMRVSLFRAEAVVCGDRRPCDRDWLQRLSGDIRRVLYRGWQHEGGSEQDDEDLAAAGGALGRAIFSDAMESELVRALSAGENLRLSLPREWLATPWETAQVGGEPLSNRCGVGRRVRDLPPGDRPLPSPRHAPARFQIWANPQFDLLMAEEEAARLGHQLRRGTDAAEWTVTVSHQDLSKRELLDTLRTTDWFHFAGHARQVETQRGWRVSDGDLSARDILAAPGVYPQFVFAHACASAHIGDVNEPSLVEALLRSGTSHYLGLWSPLLDRQAFQFTSTFYHLLLAGRDIGAALVETRRLLGKERAWRQVALANYVLYGDPDLRPLAKTPSTGVADARVGESRRVVPQDARRQVGNQPSVAMSLDPKSLQYPVRCARCGRELRSRFLVAQVTTTSSGVAVACRHCASEPSVANGPPATERALSPGVPPGNPAGAPTDGDPTDGAPTDGDPPDGARPAAWHRLLRSVSEPRRLLDPETGFEHFACWRPIAETCGEPGAGASATFRLVPANAGEVNVPRDESRPDVPPWQLELLWIATDVPGPTSGGQESATTTELLAAVERLRRRGVASPPVVATRAQRIGWRTAPDSSGPPPPPQFRCAVLVSATGWTEEAVSRAVPVAAAMREPANSPLGLVLVDLNRQKPLGDETAWPDLRCQSIARFLDWEDEHARLRRILAHIEGLRPLTASLTVDRVATDLEVPPPTVLVAFRTLAATRSLHLDQVAPFGWVLSEVHP